MCDVCIHIIIVHHHSIIYIIINNMQYLRPKL